MITKTQMIQLAADAECEGRSREVVVKQFGVSSKDLDTYFAYWASDKGLDLQQEKYDI